MTENGRTGKQKLKMFLVTGSTEGKQSDVDVDLRTEIATLKAEITALKEAQTGNTIADGVPAVSDEDVPENETVERISETAASVAVDITALREDMSLMKALLEETGGLIKKNLRKGLRDSPRTEDRRLIGMLEQLSIMREDFFRLCKSMKDQIAELTAEDVLDSFMAYGVDMENILTDCGVTIAPYSQKDSVFNTVHQRIVGIVSTDDPEKNRKIAKSLTDGYEFEGRVLLKEKVNVFKYVVAVPTADTENDGKKKEGQKESEGE